MAANWSEALPTVEGMIFGALVSFFELRYRLRARRFDDAHPLCKIFRTVLYVDRLTVHLALSR